MHENNLPFNNPHPRHLLRRLLSHTRPRFINRHTSSYIGSVDISSVFYPNKTYTFSATFLTAKTATYSHALSCSKLLHIYDSSTYPAIGRYSYLATKTASSSSSAISIKVWTNNFVGSFVQKMAVVWLVVNSNYTYIHIAHHNYTSPLFNTSGTQYDNSTPITGSVTTSFMMNSTDVIILVFSGLDIL